MRFVLDAGALIAIERGDRRTAGLLAMGRRIAAELVAVLSQSGDQILTSDPDDLTTLVEARGIPAVVVRV